MKKPSRYSQSPPSVPLESQRPAILEVRRPQKQSKLNRPLKDFELLPSRQRSIRLYTSSLGYIGYKTSLSVCEALGELSTILLLFSEACVDRIVAATNSCCQCDQDDSPRRWTPMTRSDLLRYISCLFYVPMHRETLREDYWSPPSRLVGDE